MLRRQPPLKARVAGLALLVLGLVVAYFIRSSPDVSFEGRAQPSCRVCWREGEVADQVDWATRRGNVEMEAKSFEISTKGDATLSVAFVSTVETADLLGIKVVHDGLEGARESPHVKPRFTVQYMYVEGDRPMVFRTPNSQADRVVERRRFSCIYGSFEDGVYYDIPAETGERVTAEVSGTVGWPFTIRSDKRDITGRFGERPRKHPGLLSGANMVTGEDIYYYDGFDPERFLGFRVHTPPNPPQEPIPEEPTPTPEPKPEPTIVVRAGGQAVPWTGYATDTAVTLSRGALDVHLSGYDEARLWVADRLFPVPLSRKVEISFPPGKPGHVRVWIDRVHLNGTAKTVTLDGRDLRSRWIADWPWPVQGLVFGVLGALATSVLGALRSRVEKRELGPIPETTADEFWLLWAVEKWGANRRFHQSRKDVSTIFAVWIGEVPIDRDDSRWLYDIVRTLGDRGLLESKEGRILITERGRKVFRAEGAGEPKPPSQPLINALTGEPIDPMNVA